MLACLIKGAVKSSSSNFEKAAHCPTLYFSFFQAVEFLSNMQLTGVKAAERKFCKM
jgi:hypothetical protein